MIALSSQPSARMTIIDALRGFALFGLFIVHTLEHFDFNGYPATEPSWLLALNQWIYGIVFFALQMALCPLWLRYFQYGPLEWLWRCLTFNDFRIPLRRR